MNSLLLHAAAEAEGSFMDIVLDTLLDGVKLIPFLFIAFLIIELIEHKLSKKSEKIVANRWFTWRYSSMWFLSSSN